MRRTALVFCLLATAAAGRLAGQEDPTLRRAVAQASPDSLHYSLALTLAQQTLLNPSLSRADRLVALRLLAYVAVALDSNELAGRTFQTLIPLQPDSEPDANTPPRYRSQFYSALGEVLVIRRVRAESVAFVGGQGTMPIRFQVTQPARVRVLVTGGGLVDLMIDSQAVGAGEAVVLWNGLASDGTPVPAGRYEMKIKASVNRVLREGGVTLMVSHGARDTVDHARAGPSQEETETPKRDLEPLGLSALYAGIAAGLTLALPRTALGGGVPQELFVAGGGVLALGILVSARHKTHDDDRPVRAAIEENLRNARDLRVRNEQIALENERLRRQVLLVIKPAPQSR